MSNYLLTYLHR